MNLNNLNILELADAKSVFDDIRANKIGVDDFLFWIDSAAYRVEQETYKRANEEAFYDGYESAQKHFDEWA